jgi:hypothetical protein
MGERRVRPIILGILLLLTFSVGFPALSGVLFGMVFGVFFSNNNALTVFLYEAAAYTWLVLLSLWALGFWYIRKSERSQP